jgi:hypothetical protein
MMPTTQPSGLQPHNAQSSWQGYIGVADATSSHLRLRTRGLLRHRLASNGDLPIGDTARARETGDGRRLVSGLHGHAFEGGSSWQTLNSAVSISDRASGPTD